MRATVPMTLPVFSNASGSFTVVERSPQTTPEPSALVGLMAIGVGSFMKRKRA